MNTIVLDYNVNPVSEAIRRTFETVYDDKKMVNPDNYLSADCWFDADAYQKACMTKTLEIVLENLKKTE